MENRVHESRESRRCIGETKGHDGVLIETVPSCESCLWNIFLSDLDLMVAHSQVQLGENRSSRKRGQYTVNLHMLESRREPLREQRYHPAKG